MKLRILAVLMMLFPLISNAANAEYLKIFMMQPKELILQKIDNVDELDRYMKEVEVNINKKIADLPAKSSWGFLVMAVREDGQIKAWVDSDDEIPQEVSNAMLHVAKNTKGFPVNGGAVIFALGFGTDGSPLPLNKMPFPNEWKKLANCDNEECKELNAEEIVLKSW